MKQREIKFRALYEHIDGSRIWHEVYVDVSFGWCFGPMSGFKQVSPWVQFTGLQDKNGKDIYEGDIILHGGGSYRGPGEVRWHETRLSFCVFRDHPSSPSSYDIYDPEVIGNVWEHPELLKP